MKNCFALQKAGSYELLRAIIPCDSWPDLTHTLIKVGSNQLPAREAIPHSSFLIPHYFATGFLPFATQSLQLMHQFLPVQRTWCIFNFTTN